MNRKLDQLHQAIGVDHSFRRSGVSCMNGPDEALAQTELNNGRWMAPTRRRG